MNELKGKRILILSGTGPHVKVVKKAKELGIYTIVADYLAPSKASPAKLIADESWNISLLNIDELIQRAKEANVDGVVAAWSDISQLPYVQICEALGLPCYGNSEQFKTMSNKSKFKELCKKNGVGVIEEYTLDDVANEAIQFPVVVKPVDSRASKGVSVCCDYQELYKGIEYANDNSVSKNIIIEKYIGGKNSFQVNYLFVNGNAYVLRTADGYKGLLEEKLDRVALCSISPSIYTNEFFNEVNEKFVKMMQSIGFQNGPVMAQGFYDEGVFRFYDPGLRFPGVDYEEIYKQLYSVDLAEIMIYFAITGKMPKVSLENQNVFLDGKVACILYPTIGAGKISEIKGIKQIEKDSSIYAFECRYGVGDSVEWSFTTRQRLAEIVLLENNLNELNEKIRYIQQIIEVKDVNGENMIYKPFDVSRLSK